LLSQNIRFQNADLIAQCTSTCFAQCTSTCFALPR